MCYIARISILTRADDECLIELFFVQGMNFIPLSCGAIKGEEKEESLWRGEKILPERVESRLSEFENANLTSRAVNEEVVNREPIFCPPVPRFSILFSPLPGSFATRPSRNLL